MSALCQLIFNCFFLKKYFSDIKLINLERCGRKEKNKIKPCDYIFHR